MRKTEGEASGDSAEQKKSSVPPNSATRHRRMEHSLYSLLFLLAPRMQCVSGPQCIDETGLDP